MSEGLNYQELSHVLACLRLAQRMVIMPEQWERENLPHFDDVDPLTYEQVDELCERLNYGYYAKY